MQDALHAHVRVTVASRSFCMLNVACFCVGDVEISRTSSPEPCVGHSVDLLLSDQLYYLGGYM